MTCLWCGTPTEIQDTDWPSDVFCTREHAEETAADLALYADDQLDSVRYWLDQDAMLDAMQDRMMENAL